MLHKTYHQVSTNYSEKKRSYLQKQLRTTSIYIRLEFSDEYYNIVKGNVGFLEIIQKIIKEQISNLIETRDHYFIC